MLQDIQRIDGPQYQVSVFNQSYKGFILSGEPNRLVTAPLDFSLQTLSTIFAVGKNAMTTQIDPS